MPSMIEKDWNYNPELGHIIVPPASAIIPPEIVSGMSFGRLRMRTDRGYSGGENVTYELNKNTKVDPKVWTAWWEKRSITVTYDSPINEQRNDEPTTVYALRIEPTPSK